MAAIWRRLLLNEAADLDDEERKQQILQMRRERKLLRDSNNPFDMEDRAFIKMFRFSRAVALQLCNDLSEPLQRRKLNGLSVEKKVLAARKFFAAGSYQLSVGQNFLLGLSQPSVSKCVTQVSEAINEILMDRYVKFPVGERDQAAVKHRFMQTYNFLGVVGVIDCTHVQIVAPPLNNRELPENLFVNRKGVHSLDVQLVCDAELVITNLNARYGGATHDAFLWRNSAARRVMEENYIHNGPSSWLLGDSGYPLEPWLRTPVLNTPPGSPERRFTESLTRVRNCVERCNGVLKGRFRCLLKDRVLHYRPRKAAQIVNACAVLHNIAIEARIPFEEDLFVGGTQEMDPVNNAGAHHRDGAHVRNAEIRQHFV